VSLLCRLSREPALQAGMAHPLDWLSVSERARLTSFGTSTRRATFLAGRWLARLSVQQWLGRASRPVLEVKAGGACAVAGRHDCFVSISHSAGFVACAVAPRPVGIDIESAARERDHLRIAGAVHSGLQRAELAALSGESRSRRFLHDWTRKEAWLKARQRGLDFAVMRALDFEEAVPGDVAVADYGDLVLALACDPALPEHVDGPEGVVWRRAASMLRAEPAPWADDVVIPAFQGGSLNPSGDKGRGDGS
jgi:4'-phosphopantetheinyl transferase